MLIGGAKGDTQSSEDPGADTRNTSGTPIAPKQRNIWRIAGTKSKNCVQLMRICVGMRHGADDDANCAFAEG